MKRFKLEEQNSRIAQSNNYIVIIFNLHQCPSYGELVHIKKDAKHDK